MRNHVLILKFPHSSLFGGGEQHTLSLVAGLQQRGFVFYLATSCRVLQREFKKKNWPVRRAWAGPEPVTKLAVLLWPLLAPFAGLNLLLTVLYYRFWKKVRVLYCLSLTEKILITLPARLLGMRVVWVEHVTFDRWLDKNPLRLLYRWYARLSTIVAISQVIREQLIIDIRVPSDKITVIYNGIDTSQFQLKPFRWQKTARFNVGCVARIESEKGIEFLIQAAKIVREYIPTIRLIIVGEGSERRKLAWLADRLNLKEIMQWVGHQRRIERWYHYFDVYVLPSVKRESFGITLVEAMASGVPVVGSDLGGIPEIISHKQTGMLATPGNSQSIADQLIYLYNNRDQAREMVLAAREKVETRFSLERMIEDFYQVLTA